MTGALALKNGLSPFAPSAFADSSIPTGTPRSPLFGAQKFTQRLPRLALQTPIPLTQTGTGLGAVANFPAALNEPAAKRLSYHTDFNAAGGNGNPNNPFRNPRTNRGPMEGRPPGEVFAHQRWNEFFPKVGYILSLSQIAPNTRFHPNFQPQNPNSVWTYGPGHAVSGSAAGRLPPMLIKGRYGEPILTRIYQNLQVNRADNQSGFGLNETQLHFHNAHNGAESDGAANCHHFPGTFYDYRWSTTLARRDKINTQATDPRASGPNGNGGLINVAGDWRELQGTMWAHDHRFFFTAENVYKGNFMMISYYSGRDRGNEVLNDGVNLRLPSGRFLDYGNIDFDVNLIVSDGATDQAGQYFFDIFVTDGFLGDLPLVNMAYAPFFEVLPRKYRFRILNASMSRFIQLALADVNGASPRAVPFKFIANDGNLVVNPITLTQLDHQGTAERYDIVVDFSTFTPGQRVRLVNLLRMRDDGRGPTDTLTIGQALAGDPNDPMIGAIMEFRVVSSVQSVDAPSQTLRSTDPDPSVVPAVLTEQIPVVAPVRTRVVEWGRPAGATRATRHGQCTPDCRSSPCSRGPSRSTAATPLLQRQPHQPDRAEAGRDRALDLRQQRRWMGSPDPSPFRRRHHHESRVRQPSGNRKPGAQGRLAAACQRPGHVPGAVRRIWRLVREPLPQHRARGLRSADADPVPHRYHRLAADHGHADAPPLRRRRDVREPGNPSRRRSSDHDLMAGLGPRTKT